MTVDNNVGFADRQLKVLIQKIELFYLLYIYFSFSSVKRG